MSLISVFYLLFLAASASVYYLVPVKYRSIWLLLVSYLFYLTWQPAFLGILMAVSLFAFIFGRGITVTSGTRSKRKWLICSVVVLLLPLIFFKYYNFLNENLSKALSDLFSIDAILPPQPYLIPIGISFFTLKALSYVVDIYRGYIKPEKNLIKFGVYMAFFPTLLAGPIERAKSILEQLDLSARFDYSNVRAGLQLILWGVFKKVVLADRMSYLMTKAYADPQAYPGAVIYFVVLLSVFQIFCDFSAYSDIAVGSGRIFGIRLLKNFDDRVYAAPSREIFWQGWHRSLTGWMRDYVFFPLSRGVKNRARLYLNLLIVYLLVGVWHGATWGFVAWGLLNGVWLIIENSTKIWRKGLFAKMGIGTDTKPFNFVAWLFVFHIGAFFGVFFRTDSPQQAIEFIANIANSNAGLATHFAVKGCIFTIGLILLMDLINRQIPRNKNFDAFLGRQTMWVRWAFYVVLSEIVIRYSHVFEQEQFRYFNY
jgi:alginate O-acetyltransferase complex protein AlgI